jgi:hypothetical protein
MTTTITDSFEIRPEFGIDHEPGVVVIVPAPDPHEAAPGVGTRMRLRPAIGSPRWVVVGETKSHGPGISLFFANLSAADAPIGSELEWQDVTAATVR